MIGKIKSLEFRALGIRYNTVSVSPGLDFVYIFILSDFIYTSII